MRKLRFKLEEVIILVGIYIITLGIYYLPLKKYLEKFKLSKLEVPQDYKLAFKFILLGILIATSIRIFFFIKSSAGWLKLKVIAAILIVFNLYYYFFPFYKPINDITFSSIVVLSYLLYRISMCLQSKDTLQNIENDRTVKEKSEDKLNRIGLAERIYQIIEGTSEETIRIGIYGKWGSGKTSLMNILKSYFGDKYVIGWFNPWLFENQKDTWIGFRKAFEQSLYNYSNGTFFSLQLQQIKYLLLSFFRIKTAKTTLGKLIDELIKNAGTPQQEEIKQQIKRYLDRTLPSDTKLVFFVDDLDRIDDAKRILEVLKALKEIVNLKNFIYIISIDDTSINKIISQELKVQSDNFLEKIIDYSVYLDEPLENELLQLVNSEIAQNIHKLDMESINAIYKFLPKNPRTLKRFINNIILLYPIISRFQSDEINIKVLYLAQLLKMEFPVFYRGIIETNKYISLFSFSFRLFRHMDDDKNPKEQLVEEIRKSSAGIMNHDRLVELVSAINEFLGPRDEDTLFYFRVLENSNLMTWKEYIEYLDDYANGNQEFFYGFSNEEKLEYLEKLLINRNNILGLIAAAYYEDEMNKLTSVINVIDEQLSDIIVMQDKDLCEKILITLQQQYREWSHFNSTFYVQIRDSEREVLKKLVTILSSDNASKVLEVLKPWEGSDFFSDKKEYKMLLQELVDIAEDFYIDELISLFSKEDGLNLWGNDKHYLQKWFIFQNSKFHTLDTYVELYFLAIQAKENKIIRKNFFELFRLFKYFITEGYTIIEREKIVEVLSNHMFLYVLWKGVTASPVNIRSFGILVEFLDILKVRYGIPNYMIILPWWWEKKNKEYKLMSSTKEK